MRNRSSGYGPSPAGETGTASARSGGRRGGPRSVRRITQRPIGALHPDHSIDPVRAGGGDAAVIAYDSLRTTYFGRAAFDFGAQSLVRVAERLNADRRHADALAILRRNADAYPSVWSTYYEMGRTYEALNRRDDAIAAYRATLERLPGHGGSTARLQALGAGGS